MQVSELQGAALDWAVAKALNLNEEDYVEIDNLYGPIWRGPEYSTDWSQGGPIIERERITLDGYAILGQWMAVTQVLNEEPWETRGPTPLIAAMRGYVASKLGDEVEVPEELINN